MKFADKLYKLRKEHGLSQGELGDKLNVTRQTISKWELGGSMPDTSNLLELCKLFDVKLDELTDDNYLDQASNSRKIDVDRQHPRKWLLVLLVICSIIIAIVLLSMIATDRKANKDNTKNSIFGLFDFFKDNFDSFTDEMFNSDYEFYSGTQSEFRVSELLDNVITNNKKNSKNTITVKYGDIESSNSDEIKNIKLNLDDSGKYEISFDYDDNKKINKITIDKIVTKPSQHDIFGFNMGIEMYSGSEYGSSVVNLLDKIITSNKKNKEQLITVTYNDVVTTDENVIRELKNKFNSQTKYDVSLDYDDVGFINKVTIYD